MGFVTSLQKEHLTKYVVNQMRIFFPDELYQDAESALNSVMDETLDRLYVCLDSICVRGFHDENNNAFFNHLHADHYATFLYFLSNTLWDRKQEKMLCDKLMYLNRALHQVFISYKCRLPEHFHLAHPIGTVLGNADYNDFLVIAQGVTVNTGLNGGSSPKLGKGLFLSAGSSIIGNGELSIGDYVSIGVNCLIYKQSVPDNMVVKFKKDNPCSIEPRKNAVCRAQRDFNIAF